MSDAGFALLPPFLLPFPPIPHENRIHSPHGPRNWRREREAADAEPSHHVSYLIGGFVVAVSLMTFLFYDNGTLQTRRTDSEPFLPRIEVSAATPSAVPQTNQIPR